MSTINPISLIETMHGKIAKDDDFVFAERYGKIYVISFRKSSVPPTEAQAAAQQKMASVAAQAKAIYADPEQLATYRAAWKKQKKIPTLIGYISAQLYKQSNAEG